MKYFKMIIVITWINQILSNFQNPSFYRELVKFLIDQKCWCRVTAPCFSSSAAPDHRCLHFVFTNTSCKSPLISKNRVYSYLINALNHHDIKLSHWQSARLEGGRLQVKFPLDVKTV